MSNFLVIDLIFFILIVLMLIHGYVKGFIEELFSWATVVISMLAAVFLHPMVASFIRSKAMANVRYVPEILAFVAVFLAATIILKMIERVLKDVIAGAHLGGANKILGAVFGLLEGVALTAIILFILSVQPVFDASKVIGDSIFAEILLPLINIPLNRGKEIINVALFLRQVSPLS